MPQERLPVAESRYHEAMPTVKIDAEKARLRHLPLENRITERTYWRLGDDEVRLDTVNDILGFYWRLVVNDDVGDWTGNHTGICIHNDYAVVTPYWNDTPREWVPFKVVYATED